MSNGIRNYFEFYDQVTILQIIQIGINFLLQLLIISFFLLFELYILRMKLFHQKN